MDRDDLAARTRDYVTDYIKFGDSKAGAVLGLGLAVAALLAALSEKLLVVIAASPHWLIALIGIAGVLLVVTTVMLVLNCVDALAPKVTSGRKSLASFPDIANAPDWYLTHVKSLPAGAVAEELEKHSCELSRIAMDKFTHITKAVWWLRLQILGAYALVLLHIVAKMIEAQT